MSTNDFRENGIIKNCTMSQKSCKINCQLILWFSHFWLQNKTASVPIYTMDIDNIECWFKIEIIAELQINNILKTVFYGKQSFAQSYLKLCEIKFSRTKYYVLKQIWINIYFTEIYKKQIYIMVNLLV